MLLYKYRRLLLLSFLVSTSAVLACAPIIGVRRTVSVTSLHGGLVDTFMGAAGDISSDGRLIAVLDGGISIRDGQTGDEIRKLERGGFLSASPDWVRMSPNGELVLGAASFTSTPNSVIVWLVDEPHPLYEIEYQGSTRPRSRNAPLGFFAPDGRMLAVNMGATVRFYDARSGIPMDSIRTNLEEVNQIAFSHNGELMAVGSYLDDLIEVWDLSAGTLADSVRFGDLNPVLEERQGEESEYVSNLQFSPDDSRILSGLFFPTTSDAFAASVVIWDRRDLSVLERLDGGFFASFSPDGKHIAFHRSGLQFGQPRESVAHAPRGHNTVQILTYPDLTPLTAFIESGLRWVGWADNSRVWTVLADSYAGYPMGTIRLRELDFEALLAANALPDSSAVGEIPLN